MNINQVHHENIEEKIYVDTLILNYHEQLHNCID